MKPMHGEVMMVGARGRCACCATKYGRKGSSRAKETTNRRERAGKRRARAEGKKQAQDY